MREAMTIAEPRVKKSFMDLVELGQTERARGPHVIVKCTHLYRIRSETDALHPYSSPSYGMPDLVILQKWLTGLSLRVVTGPLSHGYVSVGICHGRMTLVITL